MGATWMSRGSLVRKTSEVIGYKTGLALTRSEFDKIMPKGSLELWQGPDKEALRVRSEEYEILITHLLYELGNIPLEGTMYYLFTKYYETKFFSLFEEIEQRWERYIKNGVSEYDKDIANDPILFIAKIAEEHGRVGQEIAKEVIEYSLLKQHINPFTDFRSVNWNKPEELANLFESKSLDTQYGTFFDQRFIDYLGKNFERINDINWRKFEGFTCEFFNRHGYYVEIGPGTKDGGIDARAWLKDPATGGPPAILIQCKRWKDRVDSGVVKILYADLLDENAERGLIVTTSSLSPDADEIRLARGYPIDQVDRVTLKKWIEVMRTPGNGIFM